jgi:hypothetical protein
MNDLIKCCICDIEILQKDSHNATPVVENGRCCLDCNSKVISARFSNAMEFTFNKIRKKRDKK